MKFLIADDHPIVLTGIREILLAEYPLALIEEVADADGLMRKTISPNGMLS